MPEKAEPPGMLVLPAVLTLGQATACRAMLLQTLRAQNWPEVVVDATALQQFDSSALAVLLRGAGRLGGSRPHTGLN